MSVIFGLVLFLMMFCTRKEITKNVSLLGLEYYPTTLRKFVVYDVDSIVYTQLPKDTVVYTYRIKEVLADTFMDNTGKKAIRLERYIKKKDALLPYDSLAWTIKEVWMVNATDKHIQVTESNIRYTKLLFPVEEKAFWNGNANNNLGELNYSYDYIEKKETINTIALNNVLLVKQKDYRTLISYEYYTEKYAKGVGLVQKEIKNLLSNTIIPNKPVEDRIESGLIYKQTLVTYGYE